MDTTAATQVAELVLTIVFAVLPIVAAWMLRKGIKAFEAKTGFDIPAKQEEQLDKWVSEGIAFAEEKAHQKVTAHSDKLSGPEKLEAAADFVFAFASAKGWDDWSRDLIKNKIEAMLGADR